MRVCVFRDENGQEKHIMRIASIVKHFPAFELSERLLVGICTLCAQGIIEMQSFVRPCTRKIKNKNTIFLVQIYFYVSE